MVARNQALGIGILVVGGLIWLSQRGKAEARVAVEAKKTLAVPKSKVNPAVVKEAEQETIEANPALTEQDVKQQPELVEQTLLQRWPELTESIGVRSSSLAEAFLREQKDMGNQLSAVRVTQIVAQPIFASGLSWNLYFRVKNFGTVTAMKAVKYGRGVDPAWLGYEDKGNFVESVTLEPGQEKVVATVFNTSMPGKYMIMSDFQTVTLVSQRGLVPVERLAEPVS